MSDHTCHDMNPPFPYPCAACESEKAMSTTPRQAEMQDWPAQARAMLDAHPLFPVPIRDWFDVCQGLLSMLADAAHPPEDEQRAEADMLAGRPITGAHSRAIVALLAECAKDRDAAREQQRLGWERAAEKDRAYQAALDERDQWKTEALAFREAAKGASVTVHIGAKAEGLTS